jgi:hypothetical protein
MEVLLMWFKINTKYKPKNMKEIFHLRALLMVVRILL